jgi:hypothetical protein
MLEHSPQLDPLENSNRPSSSHDRKKQKDCQVTAITAMGPYPPCVLPPIRFVPEMIEKVEEAPFEKRDRVREE